jgi:hypothetical protein
MRHEGLVGIFALIVIGLGSATTSYGDLFYVGDAGSGGGTTSNHAGGGVWDNTTANWSKTTFSAANTAWASGTSATFQGVNGGTVNVGDNLSVKNITFTTPAAAFTLANTFDMEISGTVANNSVQTQTVTNHGTINFNGVASASGGLVRAMTYSGDGFMNFNGSSTAGNASITNNGLLTFKGTSSAGTSTIVNNAAMDISGLTSTGLTGGSLTNNGSVELGQGAGGVGKTFNLSTLTLDGGSEFDFTLGTTQSLITTATLSDLASPSNRVTIDTDAGAGFGAPEYVLIDDTGGFVNLSDYALGNAPAGYVLSTDDGGHELVLLSAVPEVSSFAFPLVGAAGLVVWLRRRRSAVHEMMLGDAVV